MNITIVQGAFLPVPPLRGGAIERSWHALAAEFSKRGHSVTHVSRQFPGLPHSERRGTWVNHRIRGYDAPRSTLAYRLCDMMYAVRVLKALPPGDILVTHSIWLPVLVRSARYGQLYVHVARMPKGQMRLYRRAARLQTVSTAVAEAIRKETPDCASKVCVIPYALDPGMMQAMERIGPATQKTRSILYVGRIHPEKGLELLIRAFALLPDDLRSEWELRILGPADSAAGGGGPDYLNRLRDIAKRAGASVSWLDPVFNVEELVRFYAGAEVFVYPSVAENGETFGLAPLEAMLGGCAVLVSDLACFKDFIREGVNGVVFDHRSADPAAALASALRHVLTQDDLRRALQQAAAATAARYNIRENADLFLQDFAELQSA